MDYTVCKFTVKDEYNSIIIINALMRALECTVSAESIDTGVLEVLITCRVADIPIIEKMLMNTQV